MHACLATKRFLHHVLHVVDGRNRLLDHLVFLLVLLGVCDADVVRLVVEGEVCLATERVRHHVLYVVDERYELLDHVVFLLAHPRVGDAVFVRLVVEGDHRLFFEGDVVLVSERAHHREPPNASMIQQLAASTVLVVTGPDNTSVKKAKSKAKGSFGFKIVLRRVCCIAHSV